MQKLLFQLHSNCTRRDEYLRDAPAVLAQFDLTESEQAAVLAVDAAALYSMGVHPLLLRPFTALNGVSAKDHYRALQTSQPPP